MSEIAFYLTIIPTLTIVLAFHEAGHLIAARLSRVRTTIYSIGAGPPLLSLYTGKTRYVVDEHTFSFHPEGVMPTTGQLAVIQYRTDENGAMTAVTLTPKREFSLPYRQRGVYDSEQAVTLRARITAHARQFPTVTGRIRSVGNDEIIVSDMQWRIGPIPFAAYVALPEDPSRTDPRAFNNVNIYKKTAIMAAGVLANLLMPVIAIFFIFAAPTGDSAIELATITEVKHGSPAQRAGITPPATIMRIDRWAYPTPQEVHTILTNQDSATFVLRSPAGEMTESTISRDPDTGLFGIAYSTTYHGTVQDRGPGWIFQSTYETTANVYTAFYGVFRDIFEKPQSSQLTSAVGFTVENARVVERVGLAGWLIMLTILSISAAIFNLLPIPPLDGGKMVFIIIESFRSGRPIPHRYQYAITSFGIALILAAGVFLIVQDSLAIF